jgi:hypothetical protein
MTSDDAIALVVRLGTAHRALDDALAYIGRTAYGPPALATTTEELTEAASPRRGADQGTGQGDQVMDTPAIGSRVAPQLEDGSFADPPLVVIDRDDETVTFQLGDRQERWVRGSSPVLAVYRRLQR